MTTAVSRDTELMRQVSDCRMKVLKDGTGNPLVVMHREIGSPGLDDAFIRDLTKRSTVYLPTHPGFDMQDLPEWARHPRDIALMHLWLLDDLGLKSVNLLGLGFGGWVAAEMATMSHQLVEKMVLVSPMGVKPRQGEIMDQLIMSSTEYMRAGFHDEAKFEALYHEEPSIDQLEIWEINREITTRLAWKPWMFNPALPRLLGGVKASTLIVFGKQDAVAPLDCGKQYQELLPNARLETIDQAGHFVELEQPKALSKVVSGFLGA